MTAVTDAVDFEQFRWRIAAYVVGALLAGIVAGAAQGVGATTPTATVVGLSLAVPFVEFADHADEIPAGTRLVHAGLVVVGGLVLGGGGLLALPLLGATDGPAVAVVAGATYAGGAVTGLVARRRRAASESLSGTESDSEPESES